MFYSLYFLINFLNAPTNRVMASSMLLWVKPQRCNSSSTGNCCAHW